MPGITDVLNYWAVQLFFPMVPNGLEKTQEIPQRNQIYRLQTQNCVHHHNLSDIYTLNQFSVLCTVRAEAQLVAYHTLFPADFSLIQLPQAAVSLVKRDLQPERENNNIKSYVIAITSTYQWDNPTHKIIIVITIPLMATFVTEIPLKPGLSMWRRAGILLYVPEILQWTLCLEQKWRYETHLINPFNLSSPSGKAWVADAIVAAWVLSGILSWGWAKRQTVSDNMQSADRCAYL